jgi:3-(3-hydroxy-phenyl)propionate hydroxylase
MRNTMAQRALSAADDRTLALREIVADLLALDEPRKRIAGMISGLDVHYPSDGDHHPMVGRRVPDLAVEMKNVTVRCHHLLHDATAILLDLDTASRIELRSRSERVRHVVGTCSGPWELPVIGTVEDPSALLIRPDGYVAWAGTDGNVHGLQEALQTWFGAA